MRRYGLRDDQWERIEHLLPGKEGDPGATAKNNRLFVFCRVISISCWHSLAGFTGHKIFHHTSYYLYCQPGTQVNSNHKEEGRLLKATRSCSGKDREASESSGSSTLSLCTAATRFRVPQTQRYRGRTEITVQTIPKTKYRCPASWTWEKMNVARSKERMLPPMEKANRKLFRLVRSL